MKKKGIITASIVIAALALAGCGWWYHHNYVEVVTDYYLIRYTPPVEREYSYDYLNTYSDPKTEIEKLQEYENEDVAIRRERDEFEDFKNRLIEQIEKFGKEVEQKDTRDPNERMKVEAQLQAYRELLAEERFLMTISHIRKFNEEDVLQFIKDYGLNCEEAQKFMKENKIEVSSYTL